MMLIKLSEVVDACGSVARIFSVNNMVSSMKVKVTYE
jgi:hypothetical protein